LTGPKYVVNFPTKRHWRDASRMEDIEAGLTTLHAEVKERGICSIAIPPLGAGLGGLDWKQVRPIIVQAMSTLTAVQVIVFKPL